MEVSQGSLASLYQGLKATFLEAVGTAEIGDVDVLVQKVPSTTHREEYPSIGLLGDLEELLDELGYLNVWDFMQEVENVVFAKGLAIKRTHIEDNLLGMYAVPIRNMGTAAATHAYRNIPNLLLAGFAMAWVDGANIFSNAHAWPGGQAWDNLDHLPLTGGNFEIVVRNLETRVGPDGQELGLTATHLIVGKPNKSNAQRILKRQFVGGGNSNIHYDECALMVLPRLGFSWFVIDASPLRPLVYQLRDDVELTSQTSADSDAAFDREEYRYKARIRYATAILCPWLIQAVDWGATSVPTTTTTPGA